MTIKRSAFFVSAAALVFAGAASAALPTEVTTAITDQATSAGEYGAAFVALAVAASGAKIGIKWIKSFFSKAT